ncbi:MAG: LacI family DNA-binding transcriptional regulator [Lachnospiraceae bacterium]|nr:LacI family DNA-binding transcriptional regulator [Lachnospiraceae bacterium]
MSKSSIAQNRITEIANAAGVSIATVSRAANHKDRVAPDTYQKILDAAASLGYSLKRPEVSEAFEDIKYIMVGVPFIDDFFFNGIMDGIEASANRHNCKLIVSKDLTHCTSIKEITSLCRTTNARGIVLLRNSLAPEDLHTLNRTIPVVQCCDIDERANISTVGIDDALAARHMTEYLISSGRRQIAFISNEYRIRHIRERERGFLEAMSENNIRVNPNFIIRLHDTTYASALSAATQLLSLPARPDAVFTSSDIYAAAIHKAAKSMNLRIPEDIAISGFDNTLISQVPDPSITTVNQPRYQMGYIAFEQLIEQLGNPKMEPQNIVLDTELVIRQST